jgi:hypothetical protein
MTTKEKAHELYETFHQYDWEEDKGWSSSDSQSKQMAAKVIDEIEKQADNWGVISVRDYWIEVRKELYNI